MLTYQTMIQDLTGLPLANASLLDEATAAAEAMSVAFSHQKRKKKTFFVSRYVLPSLFSCPYSHTCSHCHPQVIEVVKTRAGPFGVNVIVADEATFDLASVGKDVFGVLLQYPYTDGMSFYI